MLKGLLPAVDSAGLRTSAVTEWVWVLGRALILFGSILATNAFVQGTPLYGVLLALLIFGALYTAGLALLLLRHHVNVVFWLGFFLDNLVLFAAWLAVITLEGGRVNNTDLTLGSFPVIIAGVASVGWVVGATYTLVWLSWISWSTLTFYEPASYDVQQLPLRLIFIGTAASVAILVVARLSSAQQHMKMLWHEALGRNERLQRLRSQIEQERQTLEAIQTSMTEGLVVLDRSRHTMFMNPAAKTLLGLPPDSDASGRFDQLVPEGRVSSASGDARTATEALWTPSLRQSVFRRRWKWCLAPGHGRSP